jgi:hypothetical protein
VTLPARGPVSAPHRWRAAPRTGRHGMGDGAGGGDPHLPPFRYHPPPLIPPAEPGVFCAPPRPSKGALMRRLAVAGRGAAFWCPPRKAGAGRPVSWPPVKAGPNRPQGVWSTGAWAGRRVMVLPGRPATGPTRTGLGFPGKHPTVAPLWWLRGTTGTRGITTEAGRLMEPRRGVRLPTSLEQGCGSKNRRAGALRASHSDYLDWRSMSARHPFVS